MLTELQMGMTQSIFQESRQPSVKAQMKQCGSSRRQPGIFKTISPHPLLGILRTSPHVLRTNTPRTHIFCGLRVARLSEKGFWKEKKKQCYLKHERTNAPTVANTARKDLNYLISKCPKSRRTKTFQKTSDSLGNLRVDKTNVDSTQGGYS